MCGDLEGRGVTYMITEVSIKTNIKSYVIVHTGAGCIVRYGTLNYIFTSLEYLSRAEGALESKATLRGTNILYRALVTGPHYAKLWQPGGGQQSRGDQRKVSPRYLQEFTRIFLQLLHLGKPTCPYYLLKNFQTFCKSRKNPIMTSSNSGIKWNNCFDSRLLYLSTQLP